MFTRGGIGIMWESACRARFGSGCRYHFMLQKLSDQIRACHERAAEAKRKAEATADPALNADYLAAADRWMALARSYELSDRVTDFTAAVAAKQKTPDAARQRGPCACG